MSVQNGAAGRAGTAAEATSPAIESCIRAVERVEALISEETAALRSSPPRQLGDLNHRKSHGLLDLTRAVRALSREGGPPKPGSAPSLEAHIRSLQAKLKENNAVLLMHLEAMQEISNVVSRAMRDADSDGTYSGLITPQKPLR